MVDTRKQVDYKIAEAFSISELSKIVSNLVKNCDYEAVGSLMSHTTAGEVPTGKSIKASATTYSQVCIKYAKADQ